MPPGNSVEFHFCESWPIGNHFFPLLSFTFPSLSLSVLKIIVFILFTLYLLFISAFYGQRSNDNDSNSV